MVEFAQQEFDDIEAQKGFVRVLQPLLDDLLDRLKFKDSSGNWIDTTQPAVYLGYPNEIVPAYPRVHVTFNGDTDTTSSSYEDGTIEVEDPENPPSTITVPFRSTYIQYVITLTCDAGAKEIVNRGERPSAAKVLRRVRDSLSFEHILTSIHEEMNSTIQFINPITPIYDLEQTSFHDSAVMRLTFSTTNTVYDVDGGCFDTIVETGTLFRYEGDPDPTSQTRTITSVTP